MKLSKIFLAWVLSVIIGSLLLTPLGGEIALISLIFSAAASLPTLIALLVVAYTNAHNEYKVMVKRVNLTHVIMFLVTLGFGFWRTESVYYIMIVSFYAVVATIIWFLMFSKEYKEKTSKLNETQVGNADQGHSTLQS